MVAVLLWFVIAASFVEALQVSAPQLALPHTPSSPVYPLRKLVSHYVTSDDSSIKENESRTPNAENERVEAVGNLLANDEWEGLTMELSQLIRTAVVEDMKSNAREFLRSDNYDLGDISRELDDRVKNEVARLRGKEDYELGDFLLVVDDMAKNMTSDLTGKAYETGDLSKELDKRVKTVVASFCGKEDYEFGDLSKEIDRRVKNRVAAFLNNDEYEFGDITREVERKRKAWVQEFLGKDAAENYKLGDITKKAISNYTGKDSYEFGDITKKLMGNFFKKKN